MATKGDGFRASSRALCLGRMVRGGNSYAENKRSCQEGATPTWETPSTRTRSRTARRRTGGQSVVNAGFREPPRPSTPSGEFGKGGTWGPIVGPESIGAHALFCMFGPSHAPLTDRRTALSGGIVSAQGAGRDLRLRARSEIGIKRIGITRSEYTLLPADGTAERFTRW